MRDFTIDSSQLARLRRGLTRADKSFAKGAARLLKEVGTRVQAMARKFCPESPQLQDYKRMNKSGRSSRKHLSTGSLRDSITLDLTKKSASINVPANSRGGKYAERIHDKKGIDWHNRGPRTIQKGIDADEKFIYRAYEESEGKLDELVDKVLDDMIGGIFR